MIETNTVNRMSAMRPQTVPGGVHNVPSSTGISSLVGVGKYCLGWRKTLKVALHTDTAPYSATLLSGLFGHAWIMRGGLCQKKLVKAEHVWFRVFELIFSQAACFSFGSGETSTAIGRDAVNCAQEKNLESHSAICLPLGAHPSRLGIGVLSSSMSIAPLNS